MGITHIELGKIGIPQNLWSADVTNLLQNLPSKLETILKLMDSVRAFFITGGMSPMKDEFIVALIKQIINIQKRRVAYVTHTHYGFEIPAEMVCVITNTSTIPNRSVDIFKSIMTDKFHRGGNLIIETESLDNFRNKFGEELWKYLSHSSMEITVKAPDAKIMSI